MYSIEDCTEQLRRQGFYITQSRLRILKVLLNQQTPLTAMQIFDAVSDTGIDLTTVYRTLHALKEAKLLHIIYLDEKTSRFELRDPESTHLHYLKCDRCGAVQGIDKCGLTKEYIPAIHKQFGFSIHTHTIELTGLCKQCTI